MQDVVATGDGLSPAGVVFKIGGEKGQAAANVRARGFESGPDVGLALEISYGSADLMARGEELENAVAADESGASGD